MPNREQGPGVRDQGSGRQPKIVGPGFSPANPDSVIRNIGEHALIERIRARLVPAPDWLLVDVGDDAAVYEPARGLVEVITTDAIVDGVHFDRRFVPARAIGHRALAVNLSDLAAMGAAPRLATLSLVLPSDLRLADFDEMIDGLLALAAESRTRVVGGNITSTSGPLTVDVTLVGSVHRRGVLSRGGARPGDDVFVSGVLGDGRIGLELLKAGRREPPDGGQMAVARYLQPEPRVRLGQALGRRRAATAAIDLSDGLADGIARLAAASGVGFELQAQALPIHPETVAAALGLGHDPVREALAGGDDYELLFTVSRKRRGAFRGAQRQIGDLRLTRIGTVTKAPGLTVVYADGRRESITGGFEHFAS
jgi:thiamine-monophosphate kinase